MIDIGANLLDPAFAADLPRVLLRARGAGVTRVFVTGTSLAQSRAAAALAEEVNLLTTSPAQGRSSGSMALRSTAGVHPTESSGVGARGGLAEELVGLVRGLPRPEVVVAVGECGLDRDRTHFAAWEEQVRCFEQHFDACRELGLPMFIHSRGCGEEMAQVLRRRRQDLVRGGVVHSFTGSREELKSVLDLDLFVGVNGCSLKTKENLDVVRAIPPHRLLIETDAPWCSLKPNSDALQSLIGLSLTKFSTREVRKVPASAGGGSGGGGGGGGDEDDWVLKGRNDRARWHRDRAAAGRNGRAPGRWRD